MNKQHRTSPYYNLKWLFGTIAFAVLILFLTHIPQDFVPFETDGNIVGLDKLMHIAAYGTLSWLACRAFIFNYSTRAVILLVIGLMLLGALDEYTQIFVNRACSLDDWLADITGILLALIITGKYTQWIYSHQD